ncbi:hypothetical protein CKO09_10160 [Chromatium weissei]|nr:hypothetical protein [Chromatium weissei]
MSNSQERYSKSQRILHWLIAIMVFGMLTSGMALMIFGDEAVGSLVHVHMSFGALILIMMLIRVALRVLMPTPASPLTIAEQRVGNAIHLLLYVLLIGLPISGWFATSAAGETVQFFNMTLPALITATDSSKAFAETLFTLHGLGGIAVLVLVLVHTAAAIKHWLVLKDGLMNRISLP